MSTTEMRANRLYKRACQHDHDHPDEPSEVAQLPAWVISGYREYARQHQAMLRQARKTETNDKLAESIALETHISLDDARAILSVIRTAFQKLGAE